MTYLRKRKELSKIYVTEKIYYSWSVIYCRLLEIHGNNNNKILVILWSSAKKKTKDHKKLCIYKNCNLIIMFYSKHIIFSLEKLYDCFWEWFFNTVLRYFAIFQTPGIYKKQIFYVGKYILIYCLKFLSLECFSNSNIRQKLPISSNAWIFLLIILHDSNNL